MMEMTKKYRVKFNVPKYNTVYTFVRDKSACSPYGNKSAVTIFKGDEFIGIADTRYDPLVMLNFGRWCEEWLSERFDPAYEPTFEEI